MKKQLLLMTLIVLCISLMLAGCAKSNFSVNVNEENAAVITAENSKEGDFGAGGTLTVGENEMLVLESSFDDGCTVHIKVAGSESLKDGETVPDPGSMDIVAIDQDISGTETMTFDVQPGEYGVSAEVISKGSGKATISVQPSEKTN